MSQLTEIAEIAGATVADVVRVATHGGTTAADWDIAHAIQQVTGRPAAEVMWAEHSRRPEAPVPAPTNPQAVYDPEVTVYGENTSPEDPNRIAPHHPGDEDPGTDQTEDEADEATQVEELAAKVYSDLDDLLRKTNRSTGRMVRSWTTTAQARREIHQVLRSFQRRTRASHLALAA